MRRLAPGGPAVGRRRGGSGRCGRERSRPRSREGPREQARRPPVPASEQAHQRGQQQRAHDRRVDRNRERGAEAGLFDEGVARRDQRAERHAQQQSGGRHDRAGALEAVGDRLAIARAAPAFLRDPRQEKDPVVGCEAERQREYEHERGGLERVRARVAEQSLEGPVLEDDDHHAERRSDRERAHEQRLHREHDRARHQEHRDDRRDHDDREGQRQPCAEAVLEVDERGAFAAHERRRRSGQRPDPSHERLTR